MKTTFQIDATADEARKATDLPEVRKMHEKVVGEIQRRVAAGFEASDRQVLPKAGVQGASALGKGQAKSAR